MSKFRKGFAHLARVSTKLSPTSTPKSIALQKSCITVQERSEFVSLLDNTENWLYEEGEDQRRQVYVDKLAELKKKGDRICRRYTEHLARPGAVEQLGATIQKYNKFLNKFAEGVSCAVLYLTVKRGTPMK